MLALLAGVSVAASGAGLLIGIAVRRSRPVTMVALNAAVFMFFLGGGFTTVAFMPSWLQTLSRLVPTSYAIEGLRQVLFYPGLEGFGLDLGVLALTATLSAAIGSAALGRSWSRS